MLWEPARAAGNQHLTQAIERSPSVTNGNDGLGLDLSAVMHLGALACLKVRGCGLP